MHPKIHTLFEVHIFMKKKGEKTKKSDIIELGSPDSQTKQQEVY